MEKQATSKVVPRLRFSEFLGADEWAQVTLIDAVDQSVKWSFTGGPFGSNLTFSDYVNDGVRIIQLQNIGDGEFIDNYRVFTTPEKANELLSCNIYPGEIILSKMGDPVGRACIVPATHDRYVMCSDGIRLVVNEKDNNKYFVYSTINAPVFRSLVERAATGSTRKRIGLEELRNLPLFLPKKAEQQKIADCLASLDEVIATQGRNVEVLRTYKHGLMQKLFPGRGETSPRLRFARYRNEPRWSVQPLGTLTRLQSGFAFSSTFFSSKGKKLVTPRNFTKTGFGAFDESVSKYTTEEVSNKYVCRPGDLLILLTDLTPTCELLGQPLEVTEGEGDLLLNQRIVRIEPTSGRITKGFLKQFLQSEAYRAVIVGTATGTTVRHSSNNVLEAMEIALPGTDEQQCIAVCLSSLDAKIIGESRKLEALKAHRTGLVQQIYPSQGVS